MDKFGKNESESIRPGEVLGVGWSGVGWGGLGWVGVGWGGVGWGGVGLGGVGVLQKRDTVTAKTHCRCYDSRHNDTQYYRNDI